MPWWQQLPYFAGFEGHTLVLMSILKATTLSLLNTAVIFMPWWYILCMYIT
jgi:hypothetical protein